jgi:hypothetical protein
MRLIMLPEYQFRPDVLLPAVPSMADGPQRETTAALLAAVLRTRPDPSAWSRLTARARAKHGLKGDRALAVRLSSALARRSPRKRQGIIDAVAPLLTIEPSAGLTAALAEGPEAAGHHLALAAIACWPGPLDPLLNQPLRGLLAERGLPMRSKLACLNTVLRGQPSSTVAGDLVHALVDGRGKTKSIDRLRQLLALTGPHPVVAAVQEELEERLRMSCPRCQVQLRRPAMIEHLWSEHQLVLAGRRVRDPWSLIDDWIEAYHELPDQELLERCRTLARRLDGEPGLTKLYRTLLTRKVVDVRARRNLQDGAVQAHASLCPWCFGQVPVPIEEPPQEVLLLEGRVAGGGYSITVAEGGWRTGLTIRTLDQVLFEGQEPGQRWTTRGAMVVLVGPLILLAVACAFGLLNWKGQPVAPVAILLLLAVVVQGIVQLCWGPRLPADARARRYAWTLLAPRLHQEAFRLTDSAFLAGLARLSENDGLDEERAEFLPGLVKRTETAVLAGSAPPGHLAALRRLLIADAVARGADPIPLVAELLSRCFEGKLPLVFAERLLDGWECSWWTRGNLERLRILLCDRAFEAAFEVRNLLDAGQTVPSLGTLLRTDDARSLAALRLLWSLRALKPWDRCGAVTSVFDLANDPVRGRLLGLYSDLLLWQEEPTWPEVTDENRGTSGPVQIMLTVGGVRCQHTLFTSMPRNIEMFSKYRRCELILDDTIFRASGNLDELTRRLERWFRYAFLDFQPQIAGVHIWQSPDRAAILRAWGAVPCPECKRYLLPRVGEVGIAQDETAPLAQIVT